MAQPKRTWLLDNSWTWWLLLPLAGHDAVGCGLPLWYPKHKIASFWYSSHKQGFQFSFQQGFQFTFDRGCACGLMSALFKEDSVQYVLTHPSILHTSSSLSKIHQPCGDSRKKSMKLSMRWCWDWVCVFINRFRVSVRRYQEMSLAHPLIDWLMIDWLIDESSFNNDWLFWSIPQHMPSCLRAPPNNQLSCPHQSMILLCYTSIPLSEWLVDFR